jgi:hypothetical protein
MSASRFGRRSRWPVCRGPLRSRVVIRIDLGPRARITAIGWIVSLVVLTRENVRHCGLIHLAHRSLNVLRTHRHAHQHTGLQCSANEQHTEPLHQRHDSPRSRQRGRTRTSVSAESRIYARAGSSGGARNNTSAVSATGCASQRDALRRITVMATAGTTSHSGVSVAWTRCAVAPGTTAANTRSAMQTTATAPRVRGLIRTTNLVYTRSLDDDAG